MKRTAKAHWLGNLKEGTGNLTTQSGILKNTNYSFKTRFGDGVMGTNPEELLAAAHAGCFTMSVAAILTKKGLNPATLDTEATVTMEELSITGIHLSITGEVTGVNEEEFKEIVTDATKNCMISKTLRIPVSSEAHYVSQNFEKGNVLQKETSSVIN